MAQEQGPIATAAAPLPTPSASTQTPAATVPTATSDPAAVATESGRSQSLKRPREASPDSPEDVELSPTKFARMLGVPARQFTGAAALEDEKRRREEEEQQLPPGNSPNPNHRAMVELMSGVQAALSRPQDGPSESASSRAIEAASMAVALTAVSTNHDHAEQQEVSPQSAATGPSRETLSEGPGEVVDSPAAMDTDARIDQRLYTQQPEAPMEEKALGSLSYPGAMQPGNPMGAPPPPRGMSLPMSGSQPQELSPRSPTSNKKHKCEFCSTEFTRHHNLKSHLLTHSHEKPYQCDKCNMRFRRLHDLKRHGKLHTGEKPHICPKCDRKFARGDALARHSKGAGGCAGRRPSMGGNFAEDDYDHSGLPSADDSAMSGVLYDNSSNVDMSEEDRRRLSLPSIKAQHAPGQTTQEGYLAHSNTYPPAGPRPPHTGGLYPPNVDRGSVSSTTSPTLPTSHTPQTSISSVPISAGSSSLYSQSGMTESPRPLSPGAGQPNQAGHDAALARQRSPAQHPQFRQPDQPASGLSLPSHAPTGPPLSTSPTQQGSVHGRGRASGGAHAETSGVFTNGEGNVWAYVQQLEARLQQMPQQMSQQMSQQMEARSQQLEARFNQQLEALSKDHKEELAALRNEIAALRQPSLSQPLASPSHPQLLTQAQQQEQPQPPQEVQVQEQVLAHPQTHVQAQIPTPSGQP